MNYKLAVALGLIPPGVAKKATMYSYNGVVLPSLPEWDKAKYPYAVIRKNETGNDFAYSLYFVTQNPQWFHADSSYTNVVRIPVGEGYARYNFDGVNWVFDDEKNLNAATFHRICYDERGDSLLWTYVDILSYSDNSVVFLAATDPIPVYE